MSATTKASIPDPEESAGQLYDHYCAAVGGKAYDGRPLPAWKEFRADVTKKKQSDAWVEVAKLAESIYG